LNDDHVSRQAAPIQFGTENTRIRSIRAVSTPAQVQAELLLTEAAARTTLETRREIQNILGGRDERLLVIVGPCSIHDPQAALDYAARLKVVGAQLRNNLLIVMRVYFEKPAPPSAGRVSSTIRTSTTASTSTAACALDGSC